MSNPRKAQPARRKKASEDRNSPATPLSRRVMPELYAAMKVWVFSLVVVLGMAAAGTAYAAPPAWAGGPGNGGGDTTDGGTDGGTDTGTDGGTDTGTDGGTDTGTDGGTDTGTDSGTDGGTGGQTSQGLETIPATDWTVAAVRRVLNTFAFGGHASEAQIQTWAAMDPETAIAEMLTFDPVNPKLSAPEDGSANYAGSLVALQDFFSGNDADNPTRKDLRVSFNSVNLLGGLVGGAYKRAWWQAVATRGVNPFLHRMAFYLTNHHATQEMSKTGISLMRYYYDDTLAALSFGDSLTDILIRMSQSGALAQAYGHSNNRMMDGEFHGNDDFARELHQLVFRIMGETEDTDYHENVTIENTARALTGMGIDKAVMKPMTGGWADFVDPIDFTDHTDSIGRTLKNDSQHHHDCVEVLHEQVCGPTAFEKIDAVGRVAINHPESLRNIPATIVGFLADDNLTEDKIDVLEAEWTAMPEKDLLAFVRAYAVSTLFHSASRMKYWNSFDRRMILHNLNTLDNEDHNARGINMMGFAGAEGADVFDPANQVFGAQTGREVATSPQLFATIYENAVENGSAYFNPVVNRNWINRLPQTWHKDWQREVPADENGEYTVKHVAEWLWNRFIADDLKNFDLIARSQIYALLATGYDLGRVMEDENLVDDANLVITRADLEDPNTPAAQLMAQHAEALVEVDASNMGLRDFANKRIGYAVAFMSALPYVFYSEGK